MTQFRHGQTTDGETVRHRETDSPATVGRVEEAYGSPSIDVEGMLGTSISPSDPDRVVIEQWARSVDGRILDVGSGTGRWTGHLARLGHTVEGLEPVDRLISLARAAHPSTVFHQGSIEDHASSQDRWAGILAWYSLIHMDAHELPPALTTLRTLLVDGGSLLMSFFSGARREAFDHPVTTAYRWPMTDIARVLTDTGFVVTDQRWNSPAPHAYIVARSVRS